MRKIYFVFISALIIAACAGEVVEPDNTGLKSFDCFTATVEESELTKVHMENVSSVKWDVGDSIGVFSDTQGPVPFYRGADGKFRGDKITGTKFYAYYPYEEDVYDSTNPMVLKMSSGIVLPMIAKASDNNLIFKQTGSLIHFIITGTVTLNSVTLKGNSGEKIGGSFSVNLEDDVPVLSGSGASESLVFTPTSPVQLSATDGYEVCFLLPPSSFEGGFSLVVNYGEDASITKKTTNAVTLSRAAIRKYSLINLDELIEEEMSWVEDAVPPDDEIWYVTSNHSIIDCLPVDGFDQSIVSNTYSNGKGIIKFGEKLTIIKQLAFDNVWNLKAVILPNSVKELESNAFLGGTLDVLHIPNSLEVFTGQSFSGCVIRRFTGDERVQNNGQFVVINNKVRLVAASGESSLTIPGTYNAIDSYAMWASHPDLKHLTIEDGITDIGMYAFSGCKELETVHLPQTMTNPTAFVFAYCDKISSFYGPSEYVSSDGKTVYRYIPFYAPDGVTLIKYVKWIMNVAKAGLINYAVEDDIFGLDPESFCRAEDLQSISFPRNDIEILGDTFDECYNLEYISGPGSTEDHRAYIATICGVRLFELFAGKGIQNYTVSNCDWIQGYAFAYWPDLKEVTISEGVVQNGADAFWGCPKLEKVIFPSTYKSIGSTSFSNTSTVKEIWLKPLTPPVIKNYGSGNTIGLENYKSQLSIYVPEPALSAYEKDSYWGQYKGCFKTFECDYYVSSDYSTDGTSATLQLSATGAGIDLILMGDAFSDRQVADGTYDNVMQKGADAFFSEEPYKSMKDHFNVYTVNVVSATEGYEHSGQALSTGHGDGSYVYGNDAKVIEYAKKAVSEDRLDDAVVIVMMNEDAYAGTCVMYHLNSGNYGRGLSIAYFPTSSDTGTFNGLVTHEAGGHGFAKLADEYAYEDMGAVPQNEIASVQEMAQYGWWKNVDFTSDPVQVKWGPFISDERYTSENIGCYEGGLTYWTGIWRPTENSIMRYNTGGFNAPSRYAIWYRINKLAYGEDWNGTYEDFVTFDQAHHQATASTKSVTRNYVEKQLPPLAPPVVVNKDWRELLSK